MHSTSLAIFLSALLGAESSSQPSASEEVRPLSLIYTINAFGNTEPVGCPHKILHDGGLPRRMTLMRELAAVGRPILVLDGGSALFPQIDKPRDDEKDKLFPKAELITEAMSRMGYHALAVGPSDLLLGMAELTHLAGRARFPFLCANLTAPDGKGGSGQPFKSHVVLEVGGLRVGVIGLLLESMGRVYMGKVAPGSLILPAIPAARKAVDELRGKVDLVVVLSHNRMDLNRNLAREVEGVDMIIDPSIEYGNAHPRIKDYDWMEVVQKTVILRADGEGSALGVMDIDFRRPGAGLGSRDRLEALQAREGEGGLGEEEKTELADLKGRNLFRLRRLSLSPHYADDPEALALVEAHKGGSDVSEVPSRPAPALRGDYLGAAKCGGCHQKQHQAWAGGKHALAYETIRRAGADRHPECISCHTTGYGLAFVAPAEAEPYAGVQCETCHGTRPEHGREPKRHPFGLVAESTCLPCHNEDVVKTNFSYRSSLRKVECPSDQE